MRRITTFLILAIIIPIMGVLAQAFPNAVVAVELLFCGIVVVLSGFLWREQAFNPVVVIVTLAAAVIGFFYGAARLAELGAGTVFGGIAALGAVVALAAWLRRGRTIGAKWAAAGRCGRCGYDLRETIERCPECGADIPEDLARRRRLYAMGEQRRRQQLETKQPSLPLPQSETPSAVVRDPSESS